MEIDSFVSVYEDNFRCFYDQYFAQALLQMKNEHLIIQEKLPGSLANFIIWLCQQKNVTSSEIYLQSSGRWATIQNVISRGPAA